MPPGLYHTEKPASEGNIEYYVLGVSNIVLENYSGDDGYNPVTSLGQMVAVKDYIDTHYMQNINLDDLANHFHLSKFHLAREFSHTFSLSPIAYLEKRRIREARYLLSATEFSMTDIATTLGFCSSSYFSQRFKASMGMPRDG